MVEVVVAVLRGPLSGSVDAAEQGLRAVGNLAKYSDNNRRLLGVAGACEGKCSRPIVFFASP